MTKFLKIVLAGALTLGVATTAANADAAKGQKLFQKKLKEPCGMTGAKFAAKHSQAEWEEIYNGGKFEDEIIKVCPNVKKGDIKESWFEDIYNFSHDFANDSGNVPSC